MANDETVAAMGANDQRQAAAMPKNVVPEGYEEFEFMNPEFPNGPFTLRRMEDGKEFGPFVSEGWMPDETGAVSAHDEEHKLFVLRVISGTRNGSLYLLHAVDDEARTVTYLVNELRDNTLEEPEPPTQGPTNKIVFS